MASKNDQNQATLLDTIAKSVRYNLDSRYGTSRRPALFHAVLVGRSVRSTTASVLQIPTTANTVYSSDYIVQTF